MLIEPESDNASIVILGQFNPRIITPHWLSSNDMITKQEADNFEIEIVHKQVSKFSNERLLIQVVENRFLIQSINPPAVTIRDLTLKIFGQLLVHTPVTSLGINRLVHFKAGSWASLMRMGEALAPKSAWGNWGEALSGSTDIPKELSSTKQETLNKLVGRIGGMKLITMEQSIRFDEYDGSIGVKVEPSSLVPQHGVSIEVNDHYSFDEDPNALDKIVTVLEGSWEKSRTRSDMIINDLMKLAED